MLSLFPNIILQLFCFLCNSCFFFFGKSLHIYVPSVVADDGYMFVEYHIMLFCFAGLCLCFLYVLDEHMFSSKYL